MMKTQRLAGCMVLMLFAAAVWAEDTEPLSSQEETAGKTVSVVESQQVEVPSVDYSQFDKDVLVILCQNLHERVAKLEQTLEKITAAGLNVVDMQEEIAKLQRTVKASQAINISLKSRIAQLETRPVDTSPIYTNVPSHTPDTATNNKPAMAWRYTYEFGLISNTGKVRMTIRYSDGTREKIRYRYEDYATDRMFFSGNFLNTSKTTAKFQFQVFLAKPTGNLGGGPKYKVVGQRMYTTPYLAPGEVHQFDVEVPVSTIQKVSKGSIERVRAFDLNLP